MSWNIALRLWRTGSESIITKKALCGSHHVAVYAPEIWKWQTESKEGVAVGPIALVAGWWSAVEGISLEIADCSTPAARLSLASSILYLILSVKILDFILVAVAFLAVGTQPASFRAPVHAVTSMITDVDNDHSRCSDSVDDVSNTYTIPHQLRATAYCKDDCYTDYTNTTMRTQLLHPAFACLNL